MLNKWLVAVLIVIVAYGLFRWWLYSQQESSCREWAGAWLELDAKHPIKGTKGVSGYNNVGKYQQMYKECMFLQGY